MRWATSDHHWEHFNILTYCADTRPFPSLLEMNVALISRWNESIAPDDEVLVVGDAIARRRIQVHQSAGILQMLHGRKTLIRGNHDPADDHFIAGGFERVVDHLWLEEERILLVHRPAIPENGNEVGLARRYNPELVIHGHTHSIGPERGKHLNVAVDRWDLRPVPWTQVELRLIAAANEIPGWSP